MNTEVHHTYCPYCGEAIELIIDCSIPDQTYIEDCFVCCRPIVVTAVCTGDEVISVNVADENE
jgi:hypothetical protein